MTTRCRHALPSPELAGAASWELLKEWARRYPDLRPCPRQTGSKGTWNWVSRTLCERCVVETDKKKAPAGTGANNKKHI